MVWFMSASTGAFQYKIAKPLNAEENFDMAMSLEEADAILASTGFVDAEAELELV
jgi:hypothetical protein